MRVYIGADHRGFALKGRIAQRLRERGYDVADEGARELNPEDDYPVFAKRVAKRVAEDPKRTRGILICGSGIGVAVAANKVHGIRAGFAFSEDMARASREHDDTNVLALSSDYQSDDEAWRIVEAWLETAFSGAERHQRRLKQIEEMEV